MAEYLRFVFSGSDILFGGNKIEIKRNKSIDTKKELRLAKNIKNTSMIQRSTNRIKKIVSAVAQ
jgi:hypothetical protein